MTAKGASRVKLENRRLRIAILLVVVIGLISFLSGYIAANWFTDDSGKKAEVSPSARELKYQNTSPRMLDAQQIIKETESVDAPPVDRTKRDEEFTFGKALKKETAPAVDPFENQVPAPKTEPVLVEPPAQKKKKVKKKKVAQKRPPAARKRKKVASVPEKPRKTVGKVYTVQVGSFATVKEAVRVKNLLKKKGYQAFIEMATVKGKKWSRVQVGNYKTQVAAKRMSAILKKKEKLNNYVTSVIR